jgi:formate dehydrogenase maturation protein FdhE
MSDQLVHVAGGRPELALKLLRDPELRETMQQYCADVKAYRTERKFVKLYKQFQTIEKQNLTTITMEAFIARLSDTEDFESADKIIDILRKRQSNVSMDTLLFSIAKLRI